MKLSDLPRCPGCKTIFTPKGLHFADLPRYKRFGGPKVTRDPRATRTNVRTGKLVPDGKGGDGGIYIDGYERKEVCELCAKDGRRHKGKTIYTKH